MTAQLDSDENIDPQASQTHHIDSELKAALDCYEQAVKAGETVSIESFCRKFPGREDELGNLIAARNAAAKRLAALSPSGRLAPLDGNDPLVGNSLTAATRLSQLRFHARGGLGSVYKGFDEEIGREVAVKVIGIDGRYDDEAEQRFLREAEVTGRLRHPGIVPVYSRGEAIDGRPFYVMPFLEEGTLEEAINAFHDENHRYRPSDPRFRDLLGRFIAACKTVAYAHSRGVVHCDLKPQNVMLGRYGETLVIDWGLAEQSRRESHHRLSGELPIKVRGSASGSSSSGGFSPHYASPEQMDGTVEVGPPSDVYSLGVILYKLVSGLLPLSATTLGEMRKACLNAEFLPPQDRHRSVPKALGAVCVRAMSKAPADRYESPETLAADVEAFLADAPVTAVPDRFTGRIARIARREWRAVLATVAGLLLVTLIALVTAVRQGTLKADARDASRSRLQLAATLAAQAGGGEIDRRWRLLELEASSRVLQEAVEALNVNWDDEAARTQLQAHLTERFVHARETEAVKFVAYIVQGIDGRIFSRVPISGVIGKTFAYRDYFHGQGEDISADAILPPAEHVVLSSVFMSTSIQKPQVALSVPIFGHDDPRKSTVIGRLSMTITLGDLGMFERLGADEVPMLVETRKYDWGGRNAYGVVVHHPDSQLDTALTGDAAAADLPVIEQATLNDIMARCRQSQRIDDSSTALLVSGFVDPVQGLLTDAAVAPVTISARPGHVRNTGWLVVLYPRQRE